MQNDVRHTIIKMEPQPEPEQTDDNLLLQLVEDYSSMLEEQQRKWITAQLVSSLFDGVVDWNVFVQNSHYPRARSYAKICALLAGAISAGDVNWSIMEEESSPCNFRKIRKRFRKTLPEDEIDKIIVSHCELTDDHLNEEIELQKKKYRTACAAKAEEAATPPSPPPTPSVPTNK